MKTNKFKIFTNLVLIVLMLCFNSVLIAQDNKAKKVEVSSVLKDASGNVIKGATIYANEGALVTKSDEEGRFSINVKEGSVILVEADGFSTFTWNLSEVPARESIILESEKLFKSDDDVVSLPLGERVYQYNLVGAVSRIEGQSLERYTDPLLTNTLQGMASGLMVNASAGGMANNPPTVLIRGYSRNSSAGPVYIVDGIEREYDDLNPEEIETIEVLKDPSSKILYGSRAANGVILIKTRRGVAHKRIMDSKVEFGVGLTTRMPEFLNSYDYATLYNEACENDGIAPLYSEEDLLGFKNSAGENDLLYPDVDFYDYFLRSYTTFRKATANISGGNNNATYAFMAGYMGYNGLQKVGPEPTQDRFNIRANLDMNINSFIQGYINMSAIIDKWSFAGLDHADTFSALSSHRPNEYPLVISEEYIEAEDDGTPALGGSYTYPANLLGSLEYSGDGSNQFINQQMTTGLDFDLESITEGLKAEAFVAFDNKFYGTQKVQPSPSTYVPIYHPELVAYNGGDSITFDQVKVGADDTSYELTSHYTLRTTAFNARVAYDKALPNGVLNASAGFFYYLKENSGSTQDVENDNTYLKANYTHNDKYVIDGTLAYMGSNRYVGDERHFLSSAVGAAWILSEENFFSGDMFDFLKLKASYGLLGYDAQTSHYLYENRWADGTTAQFGEQNAGYDAKGIKISTWGNPDIGWEKSREINIGLKGVALNRHLYFEANYFNEDRYDMVDLVSENYSALYGNFTMYSNYQEVKNHGFELELNWYDNIGDLNYNVGVNATYSKNEFAVKDEVTYDDARMTEGKPTTVIMGYESLGLFGKDVDLASAPDQSALGGPYGIGDIAYKDQNNDGVINDLDKVELGLSFPTTQMGIHLDLNYKGFGLYVLGTASFGVTKQLTNTYYRNYGTLKYSTLAWDAYHPTRNPEGTQPSLTTTNAQNNTVTSDFWTKSGDFFRLKNVELSYSFNFKPNSVVKKSKVFVRGNNLLVLSEIDDLDPEAPNAGVTNYPVIRMLSGGISVSF